MTAKECIDQLMSSNPFMKGCRNIDKFNDYTNSLLEILEKQIPMKWQYEMVNDDDTYVCPCCKEYWCMEYGTPATNEYNYCPNCGQALKWE